MSVHLIKLAVGVENVRHLGALQANRVRQAEAAGLPPYPRHITRNTPKRAAELIEDGSIFWVIRRVARVRQRVLACDSIVDSEGRPACALVLDPTLVRVEPRPWRAFQGWRYLEADAAPPDLRGTASGVEELPPEMAEELRSLGLL